MVGATIDEKYRLLRLLGRGGMGSVYEAESLVSASANHSAGASRVALKLIVSEWMDPSAVGRFHREIRATGAIDTPYIVRLLDSGADPDTSTPYMVMELLAGEDLEQMLQRVGKLNPDIALRIGAQVCLGLAKAHEARVVHRDIKPANVFLARRDDGSIVVKILDFGVAKIKRGPTELSTGLSQTGSLLGSPRYMSPEQARAAKGIDGRSDLWSLGVTLYRAISGLEPHYERTNLSALIMAICTIAPRLSRESAPGVPEEVAAVIHRALQIEPADRYPTAAVMLEAITRLLPSGWEIPGALLGETGGFHAAMHSMDETIATNSTMVVV